ncbi:MAG: DUF3267 domain-containing protein [Candidatus Diapherotrites archaeon]|nr:DUF3267 domain-containing protein [Candidatus Diapherotrites archaeon]
MNWENIIFFPGVVFHEFAHYIACVLLGVRVTAVKWWGLREAHVTHEAPAAWKSIAISSAPFFAGSLASVVLTAAAHAGTNALFSVTAFDLGRVLFFYWLAAAVAVHCFPSSADAGNALSSLIGFYRRKLFLKDGMVEALAWLVSAPFVFLPLFILLLVMNFFSRVRNLGLAWYVVLFLATALFINV